jgi:hypothetical protein
MWMLVYEAVGEKAIYLRRDQSKGRRLPWLEDRCAGKGQVKATSVILDRMMYPLGY